MKKLLLTLVVIGSGSLFGYNHQFRFQESARKGGTFRVTANVIAWGPDTKEITPSEKPFDFGTFALNCVDQIEVVVVGGEFDGEYIKAGLPLFMRCRGHSIIIAKAGELTGSKAEPIFKGTKGKLEMQVA